MIAGARGAVVVDDIQFILITCSNTTAVIGNHISGLSTTTHLRIAVGGPAMWLTVLCPCSSISSDRDAAVKASISKLTKLV